MSISISSMSEGRSISHVKPYICKDNKIINPLTPNGLVHPYQMDESISNLRGVLFSVLFYF